MANTSAQGLRQGLARAVTSTTLSYNGDFLALFTAHSIGLDGGFNGRLLNYINGQLTTSFTGLPQAMAAMAAANPPATNFSSMITFTA
jgi:hypothetical protein